MSHNKYNTPSFQLASSATVQGKNLEGNVLVTKDEATHDPSVLSVPPSVENFDSLIEAFFDHKLPTDHPFHTKINEFANSHPGSFKNFDDFYDSFAAHYSLMPVRPSSSVFDPPVQVTARTLAELPPTSPFSINDEDFIDILPDSILSDPIALIANEIIEEFSVHPGNAVIIPDTITSILHCSPSHNKVADLQFHAGRKPSSYVFERTAFPSLKAPSYVIYVGNNASYVYRFSGNRKRSASSAVPDVLLNIRLATSRAQVLKLLQMAGIELNPGPPLTTVLSLAWGVGCYTFLPPGRGFIVSMVGGFMIGFFLNLPPAVYQQAADAALQNLSNFGGYVWLKSKLIANRLAHALTGNSTAEERKRLNRCAFKWSPEDPFTWKFSPTDAAFFVRSRSQHKFVLEHPHQWVVEKLLMRRGVKLSDAFRMITERYQRRSLTLTEDVPPSPTYSLPQVIPDVNPVTSSKLALDEPLSSRDRRSLARVTKQSGILSGLMPDLGITSSVNSAGLSISEGLIRHGQSISQSSIHLAEEARNVSSKLSKTLTDTRESLTKSIAGLTHSMQNIEVTHKFSVPQLISTGPDLTGPLKDIPVPLQKFLDLLTDVLPMLVSDDPLVALASQPALLKRYGFLTTVLVDALILFMKKFKKWFQSDITKQGSATVVDEGVFTMLYTVVYGLIFGSLPTGSVGSLRDKVMTLNALATLSKTAYSASTFFVDTFKYVVDTIYEAITGHPFYDGIMREVLLDSAMATSQMQALLVLESPKPSDLEDMTRIRKAAAQILGRMNVHPKLEKQAMAFKKLTASLASYQGEISFDSEMTNGKPRTTMVRLVGSGGIGKTLLLDYLIAAIHSRLNLPGDPRNSQVTFDYDFNFQSKLSPDSKFIIFDDPFVVQNDENIKTVLRELYVLGNSRAKKREGAALDDKETMYEHFLAGFLTDMGARADLPNNNEQGLGRRFTGGQWDTEVTPKFKKNDMLDTALVRYDNLDSVWLFTSRSDGIQFHFWQLVSFITDQIRASQDFYKNFTSQLTQIQELASKTTPAPYVTPAPGKSFIKKQVFTSEETVTLISETTGHAQSAIVALLASVEADVELTKYPLQNLSDDLGATLPTANNQIEYIAQYLTKFHPLNKGKEKEKAEKVPLHSLPDVDLTKAVVVRSKCLWHDQKCLAHGKTCTSRVDPVVKRDAWWIRQKLAHLANTICPSWMSTIYDNLKENGFYSSAASTVLTSLVAYLAVPLIVSAVGYVLSSALGLFFSRPYTQSYSTTYAQTAKRSGQTMPGHVAKQVYLTSTKPGSTQWLFEKVANNTIPIAIPTIPHGSNTIKHGSANLFCIAANLHWTVKHVFVDEPLFGKIALFGDVACSYPLVKVDFLDWGVVHPIDDSKSVVWWIPIPGRDMVLVVTPRSGIVRPDLSKFLVPTGTPVNALTDVFMALRPSHSNEVADDYTVTKSANPAASPFPIGDVVALDTYRIEDNPVGLMARCHTRTPDGSCGSLWYTSNTRVGNGFAQMCALQGAFIESQMLAVGVPVSKELYDACLALLPPRTKNLSLSLKDSFPPTGGEIAATVVPLATLPKKQGATQNLKNTIKRSPAYDLLTGLSIYHPVLKTDVFIPPPTRVPVDLRNPVRALQKMPLTVKPWSDQTIADYTDASRYVAQRFISKMDQKFADSLYIPTLSHIINGDPALGIPGIDMKKSAGWFPGNKYPGKEVYFFQTADGWDLRPEWVEEFWLIVGELYDGVVPTAIVVDNGKMELRGPAKVPRNTDAYQALLLMAVKYILYWYPAVQKHGRVANQTLYGADLNSPDGLAVKLTLDRHPHGNQGDYANFDASIRPEQSQIQGEEVVLPVMTRVRELGGHNHPDIAILAAVRTQTMTFHIFGTVVYMRWFGGASGGFLTTPFNNGLGASNYAFCWLRFHRDHALDEPVWTAYEKYNSFLCYGDDYDASTSVVAFDNLHIEKCITELGQQVTPSDKAAAFTPHVYRSNILKRTPYYVGHRPHFVLDLPVVAEIHAFIRDQTVSTIAATAVVFDSSIREWFHYGRDAFEKVKSAFNGFLSLHNHPNITLTFSDLQREFDSNYGSHSMVGRVTKQSSFITNLSQRLISRTPVATGVNRLVERVGAEQAPFHGLRATIPPLFLHLVHRRSYKRSAAIPSIANQDTTSSSSASAAPRMNDSPIESATALTSYSDDTTVTKITPPAISALPAGRTDPYPDQGMKEVLSRQYRIADISWTAAASGTLLASYKFPEALTTVIPNLIEKLKSFRYLKAGVKVSFRVNANAFAGGTLMIGYVPCYDSALATAWRHRFFNIAQSGPTLLSASRADTVEITIPWIAPTQYLDMSNDTNEGLTGSIFIYVLDPLVFSNTGAPASLSLSIFAALVDPQVAGPDLNWALSSLRNAPVKKQSGEALMKSIKGVVAGVTKATSTVAGFVGPFVSMLPVGFLDKPTSLAANAPYTPFPLRGMAHGSGLDLSSKLSLDPEAQISVDDAIFGGSKSKPSWAEVLGVPGLIYITSFTQADAADSLIASWPVRPNFSKKTGLTTYHPGNLAYYSNFWKKWRGSIRYLIRFACPSNVTARVRVSFLPNVWIATAPPENEAGDVMSKVISISGDTEYLFAVEYLADAYLKNCQGLEVADSDNEQAVGRITISVLNEVVAVNTAAVTPIGVTVWMAAGPNFVFSQPDDWPSNMAPNFALGDVTKQSSLKELFAKPCDGLVPTVLLNEKGVVTPEPFTGPLDLMHRNVFREACGNGDIIPAIPKNGSVLQYLLLPFLGWRGAFRHKYIPDAIYAAPYSVSWETYEGGTRNFLAGTQFFPPAAFGEVELPFYDRYSWRETWPIQTWDSPNSVNLSGAFGSTYKLLESVGDDFSLGPLLAPPTLTYTAAAAPVSSVPVIRKGVMVQ